MKRDYLCRSVSFEKWALLTALVPVFLAVRCDASENPGPKKSIESDTSGTAVGRRTESRTIAALVGPGGEYIVILRADLINGSVSRKYPMFVQKADLRSYPETVLDENKRWGIRRRKSEPIEHIDGSPVILYTGASEPLAKLAPDWDKECLNDSAMRKDFIEKLLRRAGKLK